MDRELKDMLVTYNCHEVINRQGRLRDHLTCLRSLAGKLQLDFETALLESDDAYQDRLRQAWRRQAV
jgi:hypothetical protein